MTIIDSYAHAICTSNLGSKPDTTRSPSDVLGAAGLASKRSPLAMAITRLLLGDNHAASGIVAILADKATGKAYRLGKECGRVEAEDIAQTVLSWHRAPACKTCGGHGVKLIAGTLTLGDEACPARCNDGRIPFAPLFRADRLELAEWLAAEVERESAIAGPAVMHFLAPRLEL